MNDDMEIMREFEEAFKSGKFCPEDNETMIGIDRLKAWLPDAVRREIVRVLGNLRKESEYIGQSSQHCISLKSLKKYIDKYSPAPRYCEGM